MNFLQFVRAGGETSTRADSACNDYESQKSSQSGDYNRPNAFTRYLEQMLPNRGYNPYDEQQQCYSADRPTYK